MNADFEKLIAKVVKASGNSEELRALLAPIYNDHCRLQHLEDVQNDILPWEDGEEKTCPKVNAEWLLRTPNQGADLRTFIDDDMKYWASQDLSS